MYWKKPKIRTYSGIIQIIGTILLAGYHTDAISQKVEWSVFIDSVITFSSPALHDITGDLIPDVVIGAGIENQPSRRGVIAVNGATGQILWEYPARNQVYTNAIFRDLNHDQTDDVIMAGRDAVLMAISGADGAAIWEFWPDSSGNPRTQGWLNFYQPQWIPDQNGDTIPDILLTNGGDAAALPSDTVRPAGKLLIINSLDGSIIAQDTMPDGKETYHAVQLRSLVDGLHVLFGTGGETIGGGYYDIPLDSLRNNHISSARKLLSHLGGGFIATPKLADITLDGTKDILVPSIGGSISLISGAGDSVLWETSVPEGEVYTSPAIGHFNGDSVPDIFAVYSLGPGWPFYHSYLLVALDGKDGQIFWQDTMHYYQFAEPNILDINGDGYDEILIQLNHDIGFSTLKYRNQLFAIDIHSNTIQPIGFQYFGLNLFSKAAIAHMDNDPEPEIIFTYHPDETYYYNFNGMQMVCMELPVNTQTGIAEKPEARISVYPNPARDIIRVETDEKVSEILVIGMSGKILIEHSKGPETEISRLPAGVYFLKVRFHSGLIRYSKFVKQ